MTWRLSVEHVTTYAYAGDVLPAHLATVEAFRSARAVLKPGGTLIITAPICSLTHFAPYYFNNGFSRYFYEHWLKEFGAEIVELQWNGNYFEYLAQELRRLNSIGYEYSGTKNTLFERIATYIVLRFIWRLCRKNKGSEQLLAFGLHVIARKKDL